MNMFMQGVGRGRGIMREVIFILQLVSDLKTRYYKLKTNNAV